MLEIVSVAVPVLLRVTFLGLLVVLMTCVPKEIDVVDSDTVCALP